MEKRTYILIGAAGGFISGGPIYQRNKAVYMKQQGWNVYYLSCCHGKVFVHGLEEFIVGVFTFLCKPAFCYPKKYQARLLDYILNRIPKISDEIVIETGTDYTAYWGELLAERVKGKHIVGLLDEYNDHITTKVSAFYQFKYNRKELACISDEVMLHIFGDLIPQCILQPYSLPFYCTNSLDTNKPDWIADIPQADLVVGYIGRLEKNAVPVVVDGIKKYALKNPNKRIAFLCIGGTDNHLVSQRIYDSFSNVRNIKVYITGLLFPIPVSCVEKCDLVFSTAGSCSVGVKAGVPTVRIHQLTNIPEGFIVSLKSREYQKCSDGNTVYDYICMFCRGINIPKLDKYDLSQNWTDAVACFNKHIDFLLNSVQTREYFDFSLIPLSLKERCQRLTMSLFGMRAYRKIWKN